MSALGQLVDECMTCDLGCRVTGNEEAAVEADASVARLILCTVNYCWRDIPAHVSSVLLPAMLKDIAVEICMVIQLANLACAV